MKHLLILLFLIAVLGLGAWGLWGPPSLASEIDRETLDRLVGSAGSAGPIVIVGLMTLAVVASPIPSAPIAMASGAAYGHFWGSIWVIIGAESGALIAFGLARGLGRGVMVRWFGDRIEQGLLGSQNALTAAVFASRLMPFVSFDLISYAAGLSPLRFWRFALATLAGIAPASFLLAHFGTSAASGDAGVFTWIAALGLGVVTGAPLLWAAWRGGAKRYR
ncbi:Uncharacterized membrane protein YdjX, TVP38/TMEM64 family, SNARE-associated domain [Palleronia marisminoris]|uniref:TVP38/TMEM64 family protein n=1 Tax=Palleronia marisminoris TaxID=315423 RepID=UPI0008DF13E2|nr:TVP38/TMEM64 family protein [Palleronia marisminoris]SFH29459.1 Uncharacterized membrane protein YdjX, TVP38/TMEM64 family, SNARE-associated domain [Palleronia marisminoris]